MDGNSHLVPEAVASIEPVRTEYPGKNDNDGQPDSDPEEDGERRRNFDFYTQPIELNDRTVTALLGKVAPSNITHDGRLETKSEQATQVTSDIVDSQRQAAPWLHVGKPTTSVEIPAGQGADANSAHDDVFDKSPDPAVEEPRAATESSKPKRSFAVKKIEERARQLAASLNHPEISLEHYLIAMSLEKEGVKEMGPKAAELRNACLARLRDRQSVCEALTPGEVKFAQEVRDMQKHVEDTVTESEPELQIVSVKNQWEALQKSAVALILPTVHDKVDHVTSVIGEIGRDIGGFRDLLQKQSSRQEAALIEAFSHTLESQLHRQTVEGIEPALRAQSDLQVPRLTDEVKQILQTQLDQVIATLDYQVRSLVPIGSIQKVESLADDVSRLDGDMTKAVDRLDSNIIKAVGRLDSDMTQLAERVESAANDNKRREAQWRRLVTGTGGFAALSMSVAILMYFWH